MNKRNCFITTYDGEWKGPANALKDKKGFEIVQLHAKEYGNFPTRKELLKKEAGYTLKLIGNLRKYNHSGMIICSNYCALILPLLAKIGLLKCDEVLWYGVYLHNPQMFGMVRRFIKFVMPKRKCRIGTFKFKIVVFSKPEIKLYSEAFDMPEDSFIYMPYGEWNPDHTKPETADEGYFFAGGYANRDYVALAELFKGRDWPLIIAASKANTEFVEYVNTHEISQNITVYWDIPVEQFNGLLDKCHAMMLIMKYNTGASGQVLLLHALERSKLVIASYTDVVDEYVQNQADGLVLQDKSPESLEKIMDYISDPTNTEHLAALAQNGYRHYLDNFSYEAISGSLIRKIEEEF